MIKKNQNIVQDTSCNGYDLDFDDKRNSQSYIKTLCEFCTDLEPAMLSWVQIEMECDRGYAPLKILSTVSKLNVKQSRAAGLAGSERDPITPCASP